LTSQANSASSLHKVAAAFKEEVIPSTLKVRRIVDALEGYVDDASWPLPKYREMLFQY